jgi:uncharacterized protein YlzI (FlbEa/FlbD family)
MVHLTNVNGGVELINPANIKTIRTHPNGTTMLSFVRRVAGIKKGVDEFGRDLVDWKTREVYTEVDMTLDDVWQLFPDLIELKTKQGFSQLINPQNVVKFMAMGEEDLRVDFVDGQYLHYQASLFDLIGMFESEKA